MTNVPSPTTAIAAIAAIVGLAVLAAAGPAQAHTEQRGAVQVIHPWVKTDDSAHVSAYLTIANESGSTITLTAAETPAARQIRIFRDRTPVESVPVPAEDTVAGEEEGVHLHLIGLTRPLREGDHIPITLHFTNGSVTSMTIRAVIGEMTMMPNMPNMGEMPGRQGRERMPMHDRSQMPMHDPSQMPMGQGYRR